MCSIQYSISNISHILFFIFHIQYVASVYDPMQDSDAEEIWTTADMDCFNEDEEGHRWHIDCRYRFYWSWWLIWSSQDTVLIFSTAGGILRKTQKANRIIYDILALTKPQQLKIIFTGNKIKLKWFSDSSIYACSEAVWQTKTKLCFIKYNYELWKALVSFMHILLWKCYSHFNMCMCRYVHILISNPFVP